ncbi:MAG: hypothetical protein A2017_16345 [Lentisphaerae bacterium GWF2_44_16]|nr:MAG: hypothetical protein A2017_16345 [Lentisphaerae bacterium GWF2_44_16]
MRYNDEKQGFNRDPFIFRGFPDGSKPFLISALNRKKIFDFLKTDDNYILLGVDGVQTFSSSRPLEHSTHRTHGDGKTTFHQYFLSEMSGIEESFQALLIFYLPRLILMRIFFLTFLKTDNK